MRFALVSKLSITSLTTTTFIKPKLLDNSWLTAAHAQSYLILMMLKGKHGVQRGETI